MAISTGYRMVFDALTDPERNADFCLVQCTVNGHATVVICTVERDWTNTILTPYFVGLVPGMRLIGPDGSLTELS